MSKIYLVSKGCYSDYSIIAAFSTKERAETFIADYPKQEYSELNDQIEEYEIDAVTIPKDLKPYQVIWNSKEIEHIYPTNPEDQTDKVQAWSKGQVSMFCWAKDEEHAAKITNERKAQLVATNNWIE